LGCVKSKRKREREGTFHNEREKGTNCYHGAAFTVWFTKIEEGGGEEEETKRSRQKKGTSRRDRGWFLAKKTNECPNDTTPRVFFVTNWVGLVLV
jgi:hypothetical protein